MIASLVFLLLLQAAEPLPECDEKAAETGVQQPMNQCAHRDFVIADRKLNAQWQITAAVMKARDEAYGPYRDAGDTRPGWFESLREAQRAWLVFRDAHCRIDGYIARGGSMEPMLVSFCKRALTQQRTQQLKELAESPE